MADPRDLFTSPVLHSVQKVGITLLSLHKPGGWTFHRSVKNHW
jgi:hypothetical protein